MYLAVPNILSFLLYTRGTAITTDVITVSKAANTSGAQGALATTLAQVKKTFPKKTSEQKC